MTRFSVRMADPDDVDDLLVEMQRIALPNDEPLDPEGCEWWIAHDDLKQPVAFAAMRRSVQYSDCGYIARAGVLPPWRGYGLQKRLIKARIRRAKQIGWYYLFSDTFENPASSNSLISCGFRLYEPMKPWSFSGALYWRLKL